MYMPSFTYQVIVSESQPFSGFARLMIYWTGVSLLYIYIDPFLL